MQVMRGSRLSHYEITAAIGKGGMGEVWRAKDTKLGRDVAIKILPDEFTRDADRLSRFEREARILASLEHPNVASIYEIGNTLAPSDDASPVRRASIHYIVMQLAEGEDLADRLARGAIPLEEAIAIARQIAEALEVAHEKGIVHRDLKPANIKLGSEGVVKVLDFGLAKAIEADESDSDYVNSPTMVRGTHAGVILGTAAYMSPEQARGKKVDRRADIWAFGVVLWEMLSGRRLFAGETISDTLAEVLKTAIDFEALPHETPHSIRTLIRQCLERNPKNRLHDMADARIVLDDYLAGRSADQPVVTRTVAARSNWRLTALCTVVALALGLAAGYLAMRDRGAGTPVSQISFERLTFRSGHFVNARFAPDGQTIFLSADWGRPDREIFQVRPKAGDLPVGLPGMELLSVSRSGELAVMLPQIKNGNPYRTTGTLAVVSSSGGTPRKLAESVAAADWAPDGKGLAVLGRKDGRSRIEYPPGKLLYESPTTITWIRISPDGNKVAFFERDEKGYWVVAMVDRSGTREVWSDGWADWWNLAWSPDGEEIWFGAAHAGAASSLYAVDRTRKLRTLLSTPGTLELHDVAPNHDVLAALVDARSFAFAGSASKLTQTAISWLENSIVVDISVDGTTALLEVSSEREEGEIVYLRSMDGSAPIRLAPGAPQELSPDGRWALAIRGKDLVALPTAAGEERAVPVGLESVSEAHWMPDGKHVFVSARESGGRAVGALLNIAGGPPRIVIPQFELRSAQQYKHVSPVSPDGKIAAAMASGQIVVFQIEGGSSRPIPGTGPNDLPAQWTLDGRLIVFNPGELPMKAYKVEPGTGRRELWRTIMPADTAGVSGIRALLVTPDTTAWAYSYGQYRSNLYLVKGLR